MRAPNSLNFVEIKRHDTALLASGKDDHPGAHAPSSDLGGGLAQVQATVQAAIESVGARVELVERDGNPTGETLVTCDRRFSSSEHPTNFHISRP